MKTKRILAIALVLTMAFSVQAFAQEIVIAGHTVDFEDQGPVVVDGRTLVPVRGVFEMLGFEVDWNPETETVTMQAGGLYEIIIQIGSGTFTTNGEEFALDVPAQVIERRTMLPIRAVLESVGFTVRWEEGVVRIGADSRGIVASFIHGIAKMNNDILIPILTPEMMQTDFVTPILASYGSILSFEIGEQTEYHGFELFEVTVIHTMGQVVYDVIVHNGLIAGIQLVSFDFEPASAPANAAFAEIPIEIGTDWPIEGILTMPNAASAAQPVPAVILVHGSGSHNMDSSLFDNRPFWDIASYLSGNGIAVMRYNQRSWTHPERFMQTSFTVWEEAIYDAMKAAEILRADERIGNIFVIGLSLGGMLAPQIAEAASLDGAILMAASPRPLYEVQYDQNIQHITDMLEAGFITQEMANGLFEMVADLLNDAQNMPNLTPAQLENTLVFGIPANYQLSIVEALPLPLISASGRPILILQGDRDFQVFAGIDFQMFLDYTQDMEHVTAILYPGLNHIFMPSQTYYNDLREYQPLANIATQVLRDITNWILEH